VVYVVSVTDPGCLGLPCPMYFPAATPTGDIWKRAFVIITYQKSNQMYWKHHTCTAQHITWYCLKVIWKSSLVIWSVALVWWVSL